MKTRLRQVCLFVLAAVCVVALCGCGPRSRTAVRERESRLPGPGAPFVRAPKESAPRVRHWSGLDSLSVPLPRGVQFETVDKRFTLKLGGRAMADLGWMREDTGIRKASGDLDDHVELRRLRFYAAGRLLDRLDYKLEGEFAGSGQTLKDAYLGLREVIPLGYVKVGHFKEPFGLEELTSSNHTTFMERALPANAFSPSRNAGMQLSSHHLDERLTWAVGVFREVDDDIRRAPGSGYGLTTRLTGLPWYEDDGAELLHLGLAMSYRGDRTTLRSARFKSRPALHLAPTLVDTGNLTVDDAILIGAEAALVSGPFSIQGECTRAHTDGAGPTADDDFWGAYMEASYFLTGEHRTYERTSGTWGRVKPKANVSGGGLGAWQVAARYDCVDLNHGGTRGGKLGQWTLGLNWHLNPNARVMLNYARAHLHHVGRADLFGVRLQLSF